ncbi:uncharacterized protein H6S33_002876 [Morchella sextelata]|uniref:uncharacterized protein n=1 Tax=Morchella sextelata TaxID=1174677 RepID=UPI001D053B15|nr:uncharacterized protein H6S33_002876 [Morchella sextelata]KAH0607842.1 hypothetical protein H6S33_002876 [Morchella sextelata]
MAHGRDERWPHGMPITLRTLQLILAVVNPVLLGMSSESLYTFTYSVTLGVLTAIYTITCLICYCAGRLDPASAAWIDFGAIFMWAYGLAITGLGPDFPDHRMGHWLRLMMATQLTELFLFIATMGIALTVVRREKGRAKQTAPAGVGARTGPGPGPIVPGMVEAPV